MARLLFRLPGVGVIVLLLAALAGAGRARADTVLVTGSAKGIGLEFVKEYAALGWTVIATYHSAELPDSIAKLLQAYPKLVIPERMDVTDLAMIDAVARRYQGKPIDVIINNAGLVGDLKNVQEQQFGHLRHDLFDSFMRTNVEGPLKISEAFFGSVKLSHRKVIVTISSGAGSFTASAQNRPGRIYYKISKAAANMAMTTVAAATQADGLIVVSINPGGVKVEKLQGFDVPGFMEPEQSISSMIRVIDKLTPAQSGAFLNFDGTTVPW